MAFSMQASSMVSLSKPDSLTMNHGTVWTVRVDTIWPDSVPCFVCSKLGKEYGASWLSNCLILDKTNPWGAGQMAHGRQKCKSMCSHSWSVSQRSYLGLVRCPGGEGYSWNDRFCHKHVNLLWNRPVTSHIHLLPPSEDSVPFVFAWSVQNPSSGHFELWNCWVPTYFKKMLSPGRSTPRFSIGPWSLCIPSLVQYGSCCPAFYKKSQELKTPRRKAYIYNIIQQDMCVCVCACVYSCGTINISHQYVVYNYMYVIYTFV